MSLYNPSRLKGEIQYMIEYINLNGTSFDIIHAKSKGKISIACMANNTYKPLCYGKYGEIKVPKVNSFFSINSFTGARKTSNIFELTANFIEIDLPSGNPKAKAIFLFEYRNGYFHIPKPSLVIDSGHGFWFLWLYDNSHICRKKGMVNKSMLTKWEIVQQHILDRINQYSQFPADKNSMDVSRVMRCSSSINHKPGKHAEEVKIVEHNDDRYTLETLCTYFTGLTQEQYYQAQNKQQNKKINKISKNKSRSNYNLNKTNQNRVSDLEKLVKIRDRGFTDSCGYRELYLFVYAYHTQILTHDITKTLDRLFAINNLFTNPLTDKELETNVINSIEQAVKKRDVYNLVGPYAGKRGGYNYKTSTLIELFNITSEEQQQLSTLCETSIKKNRHNEVKKANRRVNGVTKREQNKINNINSVHFYYEQGKSITEIAEIMKINKSNVSRYLKLIKPPVNPVTASDKKTSTAA